MRKQSILFSLLMIALLALGSHALASDHIQVVFTNTGTGPGDAHNFIQYADGERGIAHFVYDQRSDPAFISTQHFTAEIRNVSSFTSAIATGGDQKFRMEIYNGNQLVATYTTQPLNSAATTAFFQGPSNNNITLVNNVSGASSGIKLGIGSYDIKYYYVYTPPTGGGPVEEFPLTPSAPFTTGANNNVHHPATPSKLNIQYRAQLTGSFANAKPRMNEQFEIGFNIFARVNEAQNYTPRIDVVGGVMSSYHYNSSNGQHFVSISRVSQAGKDALKLTFDGTVVRAWDVEAGQFPGMMIDPGTLRAEEDVSIRITPLVNDDFFSGFSLRELDGRDFRVELTGVPIYVTSVSSWRYNMELSELTSSSGNVNQQTFRKLVFDTGDDLSANSLRFAGNGTLDVKITSSDGRYFTTVKLPVERSNTNDGIFGAPPYMSYAGETTMSLRFQLPSGRPVREYSGTISAPGMDTINIGRSSETSFFYETENITFEMMGRGTMSVRLTTVDSDYDSRSWSRDFAYSRPTMSLSQNTINLDDEMSVIVYLRDANGSAVNNGTVVIDGIGERNSSGNGEYRFTGIRWNVPGHRNIQAYAADGTLLANFNKLLHIKAPELLTLTSDSQTVVSGADHTIRCTVTDENGREVGGARFFAIIDDGEEKVVAASWNSSTRDYSIKLNATDVVVLRAETGDGRKISNDISLIAAKPEVRSNLQMVTANYAERLVFTFFSPTGEPLSGTVALRGVNLQVAERNIRGTAANGTTTTNRTGVSVEMDFYCRPTGTGAAAPHVAVDFTFGGRTYKDMLIIPVGEASLTVTPQKLMAGVQDTVTVEIKGASGKGIPGVGVEFLGMSTSSTTTTNNDGKASFNVTPVSTATEYTIEVTRTDQFVQSGNRPTKEQLKIPVERDTQSPVMTITNLGSNNYIEVETSTFTFDFALSDNVGLDTLFVGLTAYPLSGTSATHSETVSLSLGDNNFSFMLRDRAGNQSARRDVTVRYTMPAPPQSKQPIILSIGSTLVIQGTTILPPPPKEPITMNGRTMLPFRYLVQTVLGGRVDYIEATEAINAWVNGHEINMVVGDERIYVDGVQVILDQAPYETDGHTLVPLRAFERIVTELRWDPVAFAVTIIP